MTDTSQSVREARVTWRNQRHEKSVLARSSSRDRSTQAAGAANQPVLRHDSSDPISERRVVEIEQEAEAKSCRTQVGEQLGVVCRIKSGCGLQLNDEACLDDEVYALAWNRHAAIMDGDGPLSREANPTGMQFGAECLVTYLLFHETRP